MKTFRKWGNNYNEGRNTYLKKTYGITSGQYDTLLIAQDEKCAICKVPQAQLLKRFAVDHNLETGRIRGLLCTTCNSQILPTVEYFSNLILPAKRYLKVSPSVTSLPDIVTEQPK